MPPELTALLDNVGTVALAVFSAWLVITGRLVPRRTHQDVLDQNRALRDKDDIKDATIAEQSKQLDYLGHVAHIVESMFSNAQKKGGDS